MENTTISIQDFHKYINAFLTISNDLLDEWKLNTIDQNIENNKFLTKKQVVLLRNPADPDLQIIATFEYHLVYNISYAVPVLCFNIWRQDGSRITLEEYWNYNKNLHDYNMHDTLTQMDHPVLNKPIFTLHPCKTYEILKEFLKTSKNPVISWLSVVSQFVHLDLLEEYLKSC